MHSKTSLLFQTVTAVFAAFLVSVISMPATANDNAPLDFAFIKTPPGELIPIGNHQLHVTCMGEGETTILFEAGLGGSSLEWLPIQKRLPANVMSCAYDRGGYAWSGASGAARTARQLAMEANQLLKALDRNGPTILVGHSFGGFIIRLLADLRPGNVAGLILVDASHEDQIKQYEQLGGASPIAQQTTSL